MCGNEKSWPYFRHNWCQQFALNLFGKNGQKFAVRFMTANYNYVKFGNPSQSGSQYPKIGPIWHFDNVNQIL